MHIRHLQPALHAKDRSQRGFAQCHDRILAYLVQSEGQSDRNGGLANTSLGGSDGGYQDQVALLYPLLVYQAERYFGHVPAEADHLFTWYAHALCHILIFLSDVSRAI